MTWTYSVENPVLLTFLIANISSVAKPLTFTNDIVALEADTVPCGWWADDVMVDELATYNWPPTAFTVSFSNTVVDNVPLIFTFSNSALPFCNESILQPFWPDAKFAVSILPLECNIKLFDDIVSVPIVHPAILFSDVPNSTIISLSAVPVPSKIFNP